LLYTLKSGQTETAVLKQMVTAGMPLPADTMNRPELAFGLEIFWRAYWDLASCRNDHTGLIPWDKVQLWAETYRLDGDTALDLHYAVRGMDTAWLAHKAERQATEKEQPRADRRDVQRKHL
jgi:hypothetical protein